MIKRIFLITLVFSFFIISDDAYASNWDYSYKCVGSTPYKCHNGLSICSVCTAGRKECRSKPNGTRVCQYCPSNCAPPCSPTWGSWSACNRSCGGGTQSRTQTCTGRTQSQSCNTHPCPINGQCNLDIDGKEYPYGSSTYGVNQCANGNSSNTNFPPPEQVVTWTCSGQYGGTTSGTCSASRAKPDSACGNSNGIIEINTKADIMSEECAVNNTVNESVTFNVATGKWDWTCAHDYYFSSGREDSEDVECSAPSCLASDLIKYNGNVYLKENPNDQTVNVSLVCNESNPPKICCDINAVEAGSNPVNNSTHICTEEGSKEIIVPAAGTGAYPAQCYFVPPADPTCENDGSCPNPKTKTVGVTTMCSQRECNAQGTCQSTPKAASNLNQCSSTCNSNADCSSGRIIETRP